MNSTELSLPEQAYLIAWDRNRGRMRAGGEHATMVTAAMLIELQNQGAIRDDGKHPVRASEITPSGPGRLVVLQRIHVERPRTWRYWVTSLRKAAYQAVREQLADDRVIGLQERSLLGIPLPPKVTMRDARVVGELVQRTRSAVLGSTPADRVPAADAALAALVAAAEIGHVLPWRERRQAKKRIKALTERSGPAAKAFRKTAESNRAAAAS